jgi:arabinose-5-phosphate isomerase
MEVVHQVTKGRFGLCVVGVNQTIDGIITDGDLRRTMERYKESFFGLKAGDIMTIDPVVIDKEEKLTEAQKILLNRKITTLLVASNGMIEGVIQLYDIKMN